MTLDEGEIIVTAYAESAAGPGWANTPVWVIVRRTDGTLREDCLQPDEQDTKITTLYPIAAAAHGLMVRAVRDMIRRERGGT